MRYQSIPPEAKPLARYPQTHFPQCQLYSKENENLMKNSIIL